MKDIQYPVSYKGSCPNSVASTLKAISFDSFANIKVALRILATLPVTSCECDIYTIKHLKVCYITHKCMLHDTPRCYIKAFRGEATLNFMFANPCNNGSILLWLNVYATCYIPF